MGLGSPLLPPRTQKVRELVMRYRNRPRGVTVFSQKPRSHFRHKLSISR